MTLSKEEQKIWTANKMVDPDLLVQAAFWRRFEQSHKEARKTPEPVPVYVYPD